MVNNQAISLAYPFIALSDAHVERTRRETENFAFIVERIGARFPGRPVLLSGDLLDDGTKEQMETVSYYLNRLRRTNIVIPAPGNHDFNLEGNIHLKDSWENWKEIIREPTRKQAGVTYIPSGHECLDIYQIDNCFVFALNSGDPNNEKSFARGYIGKGLAITLHGWLEDIDSESFFKLVCLHHHPITQGSWFTALIGAGMFMKAVSGRCHALIFGHNHRYLVLRNKRGIDLICALDKATDPMSESSCFKATFIDYQNGVADHWIKVL